MGEKRNAHRISVAKLKRKISLERHGCKWEDTIKLELKIWEGSFSIGGRGALF